MSMISFFSSDKSRNNATAQPMRGAEREHTKSIGYVFYCRAKAVAKRPSPMPADSSASGGATPSAGATHTNSTNHILL